MMSVESNRQLMDAMVETFAAERQRLEAELAEVDRKETLVREALTGIKLEPGEEPPVVAKRRIVRPPSVPDDKYAEVLDWLRKNPNSRQADIAANLKINSGIISQAMKLALARQDAEVDRAGRGAHYTATEPRETVVKAGDGVRKGRRTAKT